MFTHEQQSRQKVDKQTEQSENQGIQNHTLWGTILFMDLSDSALRGSVCVYCLGAVVDIFEMVSVCVLLRGSGGHL